MKERIAFSVIAENACGHCEPECLKLNSLSFSTEIYGFGLLTGLLLRYYILRLVVEEQIR